MPNSVIRCSLFYATASIFHVLSLLWTSTKSLRFPTFFPSRLYKDLHLEWKQKPTSSAEFNLSSISLNSPLLLGNMLFPYSVLLHLINSYLSLLACLPWYLLYFRFPLLILNPIFCRGNSLLYPSWVLMARLIIKLTQDRLTEKKKEEMNFNSCAWRSPRNGSWEVVKQALDCVLLPTSNKCAYSTAGMFLVVLG